MSDDRERLIAVLMKATNDFAPLVRSTLFSASLFIKLSSSGITVNIKVMRIVFVFRYELSE